MKKFLKFVAGVAAVAGAACGVVYCLKKFCGIDLLNRDEDSMSLTRNLMMISTMTLTMLQMMTRNQMKKTGHQMMTNQVTENM